MRLEWYQIRRTRRILDLEQAAQESIEDAEEKDDEAD